LWALTAQERVRIRSIIDSAIASAYGLSRDELRAILSGCDHPVHSLANNRFTRTLDPKGFWRVDRYEHPELRQTVLTMVAYQELERIGLDAFLNLNDGEGWMLPENLRLADYDLGCDDRAKEVQPVAPALGPRFYDWQLAQPAEESWEECAWHAELLEKLVPTAQTKPKDEPKAGDSPTNLFGEPIPTDLFGNPIYSQASKKKAR
jgi:hypothetical protein